MKQLHDGEWTTPVMRGYILECCDCGLRHTVDFKVKRQGKRNHVMFRATRKKK